MKKLLYRIIIPAVLAFILFTCGRPGEEKQIFSPDESAIAITLTAVSEGEFSLPVVNSGLISTEMESKLSFKVGGIISKVFVSEGEGVTKGQLLATLDMTEIDAQLSQAKNNLTKAKRDLERGQRLYQDSAATLEQIQNLQTAFDVANEAFTIASFNKQFASIRATTSGKVIRKYANSGEQVSAGMPVFMVNSAGQNNWIVKTGLPDIDWVRVTRGDLAKIKIDVYPGKIFDGEVSLINEGADPVNGLYLVEVKIKPDGKKLASGLFARVEIMPSAKTFMHKIPIEAVVEGHNKEAFVFVVNKDQKSVKKIPITIAFITGDSVMVSKGLDGIHQVVMSGSAFLTEFSTVKVAQR